MDYKERDRLFKKYINEYKKRFNIEPSLIDLRIFVVNNNTEEKLLKRIEELQSFEGAQIP